MSLFRTRRAACSGIVWVLVCYPLSQAVGRSRGRTSTSIGLLACVCACLWCVRVGDTADPERQKAEHEILPRRTRATSICRYERWHNQSPLFFCTAQM